LIPAGNTLSLADLLDMGKSIEPIENPSYEEFFVSKRIV
jgi:hypothetical protein